MNTSHFRRIAMAGLLLLAGCSGPAVVPAPGTSAPSAAPSATAAAPSATTAAKNATAVPSSSDRPSPSCGSTRNWGTGTKESPGSTTNALYLVTVSRHGCYDEVVFTINGAAAAGFTVRYVPLVTADPSGKPLPVAGNAVLQAVIRAPAQGYDDSGHQPGRVLAQTGDYLAQPTGWPSLRAVRFAGSFEGQSTFAIGVRARVPFRVSSQEVPADQLRRVIVDLAH